MAAGPSPSRVEIRVEESVNFFRSYRESQCWFVQTRACTRTRYKRLVTSVKNGVLMHSYYPSRLLSRHRRMPIKSQRASGKKVQSIGSGLLLLLLAWPAASTHHLAFSLLYYTWPYLSIDIYKFIHVYIYVYSRLATACAAAAAAGEASEGLPKLGSGNYGED